jgi:putative endonuclease
VQYYVYILASAFRGTLYVGVSNDLVRRVWEHKAGIADSFSKKYDIKILVYFEIHTSIESAIKREKSIKRWTREKKYFAIEENNPFWHDLYESLH